MRAWLQGGQRNNLFGLENILVIYFGAQAALDGHQMTVGMLFRFHCV